MSHAYLISGHTGPEQISRLARRLGESGDVVLMHLNRHMPASEVRHILRASAPVEPILIPRAATNWGRFSLVEAQLRGMAVLMDLGRPFEHFSAVSGQDYPIKPAHEIRERLARARGVTFLKGDPLPLEGWKDEDGGWPRIRKWHIRVRSRHIAIPARRSLPVGLRAHGGPGWWTMSREAVREVLDTVRRRPEIPRFFRHVDIPDELFFHTILLSSPLRDRIGHDSLRHVRWDAHRRSPTGSPDWLMSTDLEELRASTALFARKFDPARDRGVLDLIDRELLGQEGGLAVARGAAMNGRPAQS